MPIAAVQNAWETMMFSVVFEVRPRQAAFDLYLSLAKDLRPILESIDGFIDNERFESTKRPGWILSHSTWRDEKSLVRWRTTEKHHETQLRGREEVFRDYHLRVGEIVADSALSYGASIVEQRLDETANAEGKYVTLTECGPSRAGADGLSADALGELVGLRATQDGLAAQEIFTSISNKGKLALLGSWRDRSSAQGFKPHQIPNAILRHRVVRVVRDYGMFDRRESPQYYPDVHQHTRPTMH
jgi:heme-degrading monooxygenase HmoA